LKRSAQVLLKGEVQRRQRGAVPAITAQEIAEIKPFSPRDKFFIFGHARSGTTLLMRLVRLHPDVHCNYQAHFFTRRPLLKSLVNTPEAEEWLRRKSNRWNHGGDLSAVMLRAAADFVMEREALPLGKSIVGDKSPLSNIHGQAVREMASIYPDAKLIYIVRDGRDVLVSERFRNFVEESKFLSGEDRRIVEELRKDPEAFSTGRRSLFSSTFVRRMATSWVTDLTEVEVEGKRLYPGRFLTLRYEDLLREPFEEISKTWRFLGVEQLPEGLAESVRAEMASNPDEEWQSRRNEGIASFLPKGQAGNWRTLFTAADKELFKQLAGQTLLKWGYETSQDW
ncbi:MAG: sulfotransferase family protein, partial [Anaerolineae bacterium]